MKRARPQFRSDNPGQARPAAPGIEAIYCIFLAGMLFLGGTGSAGAQIFTNLNYIIQYDVGDEKIVSQYSLEGPKGIATVDLDQDGFLDLAISNSDGTITVLWGRGGGRFGDKSNLRTGGADLRGITTADFNRDNRPDLVAVSPFDGHFYLFLNLGSRRFGPAAPTWAWTGARNLVAGDFDGDGWQDLAVGGTTNGVRHYRGLGNGEFSEFRTLSNLANTEPAQFPRPVFSFKVLEADGLGRQDLVATHAHVNTIYHLHADVEGGLGVIGTVQLPLPCQSLEIARITTTNGPPDLLGVHIDAGVVNVYRGTNHPGLFMSLPTQTLHIPGGPRAVRAADIDGDGWQDLVVVVRNMDIVLTYRNVQGRLEYYAERPVGLSPREVVTGDFNGDDRPDAAVLCHDSENVTILLAHPETTGFTAVDHMYLVDGNVAGLTVFDFNRDGRDDVIQLHRASGDFSVRLAEPDGLLGPPSFYTIGQIPAAQAVAFVNNDAIPDIITANMGVGELQPGSVSVRLGNTDGTFGLERRFSMPQANAGRLYALVPADLDGDGAVDLAAGYLDGRLAFFQGAGDGTFTFTREHRLRNTVQGMVAGDFDEDGDLDLALVDLTGELLLIHNRHDLLHETALTTDSYPPLGQSGFGASTIKALRFNPQDNDLDLVIGSREQALLYQGGPGMGFTLQSTNLGGVQFPVGSIVEGDFNADGVTDLIMADKRAQRIIYLTQQTGFTNLVRTITVDVPSSKYLAAGDLDGDGQMDLVGTGEILWTALSGRTAQNVGPLQSQNRHPAITAKPVINEILAANTALELSTDRQRITDWVELYNGTLRNISMANWRLRLIKGTTESRATNDYKFPASASLLSGAHLVIMFSDIVHTVYHTGFPLPAEGGTLVLLDATGTNEVDRVTYPPQLENVSYARFTDGASVFTLNPYPSPNEINIDNGRVVPDVQFTGVDPATLKPGLPIRISATASEGEGLAGLSFVLQRLDQPAVLPERVLLYDDGLHGDGVSGDGVFAGYLTNGLPAGAECQYYLELIDLYEQTFTLPEDPVLARPGQVGNLDTFGLWNPTEPMPFEISEVVPYNITGLTDEMGGTPDWLEVRNISTEPSSLRGLSLSHRLGDGDIFYFPEDVILQPGEHVVVFCDNSPEQGPWHAPFALSRSGDQVVLCTTSTNGARALLDYVRFPNIKGNSAWARLGAGGVWRPTSPTPFEVNITGDWTGLALTNNTERAFAFGFPTAQGVTYTIYYRPDLSSGWTVLRTVTGNGLEQAVQTPLGSQGFFRLEVNR